MGRRVLIGSVCIILMIALGVWLRSGRDEKKERRYGTKFEPRANQEGMLTVWWDGLPEGHALDLINSPNYSNILRKDYVGTDSCKPCHKEQHSGWSKHPHRWMNAAAGEQTVKGDFSGNVGIEYLGGTASFLRRGDLYIMDLKRGDIHRTYEINQTIGSRFFQYYVGRQVKGPEPPDHPYNTVDHVLPFGYWLTQSEWVPIVHVRKEAPDGQRDDPFSGGLLPDYALGCSQCHTTRPIGDWIMRQTDLTGQVLPRPVSFLFSEYVKEAHPQLLGGEFDPTYISTEQIVSLREWFYQYDVREHGVSQGITCEACHNGCREHVANPLVMPRFFPSHTHLHAKGNDPGEVFGRSDENLNWVCSRCHTGTRPLYEAGMATWNSTEFSDAAKGACYSKLRCVDCHDPHEPIGAKWTHTPEEDDQSCLTCHKEFKSDQKLAEHTHHSVGSEGSRCMNCHMPKINEGMETVVRTHTIFSPTQKNMIESNQANACNLCHTDQSIDWTLGYLKEWYGATFNDRQIGRNYKDRSGPIGRGWLASNHEATRLVAGEAMIKGNGTEWALPEILELLDDPFLLNRQFAQFGLEQKLGIKLIDFGYRFYMTPEERAEPMEKIRKHFQ